jgi:prefoldin alpha subunit
MSFEQLSQLKQQEQATLNAITNHYKTLRHSSAKCASAKKALEEACTIQNAGVELMIPLTESLYVPGTIQDPTRVLVDLGTGFYAEKNVKDAVALMERKMKLVDVNSENVLTAIQATRQNVDNVSIAIQGKVMEIQARQEGQKFKAAQEA